MLAFAEGGGRGVRPAAHLPSFASPKERRPRKGDPAARVPLALRTRGQPAMLEAGVRLGTRCVLRTPLKHLRRVRSRSACVLRHTRHPSFCASRHGQKGVGTGSTRAIAALGLGRAIAPKLSAARTARVPDPRRSCEAAAVWYPLPTPSGCAEKRRAWGGCVCRRTHALRHLACRSCLSGVRRTQRVLRHHPRHEHRRLPPFARQGERGTQTGGRLLFGDFLLATQEKVTAPPGAHPGLRPRQKNRSNQGSQAPQARSTKHNTNPASRRKHAPPP